MNKEISDTIKADALESALHQFTGTENYYRHFGGLIYTDGIKYLAEVANSFWLIDLIASYQPQLKQRERFQVWTLQRNPSGSGATACAYSDHSATDEDFNRAHQLIRQEIEYTDFPLAEIELYAVAHHDPNGKPEVVLMLKSEY